MSLYVFLTLDNATSISAPFCSTNFSIAPLNSFGENLLRPSGRTFCNWLCLSRFLVFFDDTTTEPFSIEMEPSLSNLSMISFNAKSRSVLWVDVDLTSLKILIPELESVSVTTLFLPTNLYPSLVFSILETVNESTVFGILYSLPPKKPILSPPL